SCQADPTDSFSRSSERLPFSNRLARRGNVPQRNLQALHPFTPQLLPRLLKQLRHFHSAALFIFVLLTEPVMLRAHTNLRLMSIRLSWSISRDSCAASASYSACSASISRAMSSAIASTESRMYCFTRSPNSSASFSIGPIDETSQPAKSFESRHSLISAGSRMMRAFSSSLGSSSHSSVMSSTPCSCRQLPHLTPHLIQRGIKQFGQRGRFARALVHLREVDDLRGAVKGNGLAEIGADDAHAISSIARLHAAQQFR